MENPNIDGMPAEESPEQTERITTIIDGVKKALEAQITEGKDLKSLPRYMLVRPFRGVPWTEDSLHNVLRRSGDTIQEFCNHMGIKYPATDEAEQLLLNELDSSEMQEKVKKVYSGDAGSSDYNI